MRDRVPLYPGRVKLVPVAGQENVYDMVRADQPTQEGTPLNKASLLTDATAALFGLGTDAVPDDMLNALAHTGDLHVWKRTVSVGGQEAGYTLGEIKTGQFAITPTGSGQSSSWLTFSSISVSDNGDITPTGSSTSFNVSATGSTSNFLNNFRGNFGKLLSSSSPFSSVFEVGVIYYFPEDITAETIFGTQYLSGYQTVTGNQYIAPDLTIDYPTHPNRNGYQDGTIDDTAIEYIGQLGDKAHIVTGSYVGTGTYGKNNPTALTFEFEPKMLMIKDVDGSYNVFVAIIGTTGMNTGSGNMTFTWEGKTVSWYNNYSADEQRNAVSGHTGLEYKYVALG